MLIVTSFLAAAFTFMSYMINGLTIATILLYTSILFTSVFAFCRFSEKIDRFDAINLVISIISILLIMNFFEHNEMRITEVIIGICGAMFLGISYVIVKDMDDSINFLSLTFYE
jgi:drug/metabolite transporter (DMT)-like permease